MAKSLWVSRLEALHLIGRMIVQKSKGLISSITGKFKDLEKSIEEWSKNALNPEVESAFEAVSGSEYGVEVENSGAKLKAGSSKGNVLKQTNLKHHLLNTEQSLKESLSKLKLSDDHVLFVDGIDFRPESVSYFEYIECVKGLAEAAWQLNTEFFNGIRDSKGRVKIVLLLRPDVFHALNLYNSNSRLQDNTVYLDWSTNEGEYKESPLYELSGRYFAQQQPFDTFFDEAWEHYYHDDKNTGKVFKRLLRQSYQKPRDVLTLIRISRGIQLKDKLGELDAFEKRAFEGPKFTRAFSDYLLGEAKNYAAFYMTQKDFQTYMKFFQYLYGKPRFDFDYFSKAYAEFYSWAKGERIKAREALNNEGVQKSVSSNNRTPTN